MQFEEEVFYLFVCDNGGEVFKDFVDEVVVEYVIVKDLIKQLNGMYVGDDLFVVKFIVLVEYVLYYVEEEEIEFFFKFVCQYIDLILLQEFMIVCKEVLFVEIVS